ADRDAVNCGDFVYVIMSAGFNYAVGSFAVPITNRVQVILRLSERYRDSGAHELSHLEVNQTVNGIVLVGLRAAGIMALFLKLFVLFFVIIVAEADNARCAKRLLQFQDPIVGIIRVVCPGAVAIGTAAHPIAQVISVVADGW